MMWEKVGVEKDAAGLRFALADIERFRRDLLPRMGLKRTALSLNYEWLDAIDAVNMIDACELIIRSSLEREESRGPFMRHDFPQTDNAIWLAANVMRRTENGFCFARRPYELPFFQPDFVRKDNLEVAVVTIAGRRLGAREAPAGSARSNGMTRLRRAMRAGRRR